MEDREKNACIAQLMDCNKKEKNKKKKKAKRATEGVAVKTSAANSATANNGADVTAVSGVRIALFDFSVENFFRDMDTIVRLCGQEDDVAGTDQMEIQRMSSSVIFLRYKQNKFVGRTFVAFNLMFIN